MLQRSFTVDVFKVVAAQLIVWHHFSAYGPMSDTMNLQWPQLIDWLYNNARLAVQVFLVVGGFLAAQSVMNKTVTHPVISIVKRFLRLAPIYMLTLSLITLAVALSRANINADWLPNAPTFSQFLAHAFLVHDLLGVEALSSGVWYVAIDFQLFVVLVVLCNRLQGLGTRALSLGVALLCVASMGWFNRERALDIWAIYFFGAYGLGVLAAWAKRSAFDAGVFWVTALLGVGALWVEYRTRLNLALVIAIWLTIKPKSMVHWTPMKRVVHRLANSAYVLFLTHFGVIVVFSAMWNTSHFYNPVTAFALTGFAWGCAVGLGLFLHERVEIPVHHWISHQSKLMFLRLTN
ncbi:acyltransferase family protein [Limnohabitans sp.]|uniref:acyltransferase family protein n=1 Tax=Limnohabitans sp. TaxID=1907725 RepID=UPI00286EE013|nr:acyltransferase family protein [Limnohabitans sp.]